MSEEVDGYEVWGWKSGCCIDCDGHTVYEREFSTLEKAEAAFEVLKDYDSSCEWSLVRDVGGNYTYLREYETQGDCE